MKAISFRLPDDVAEWLRVRAANETIKRRQYVSINTLVLDLFRREMKAEGQEEATDTWAAISLEADKLNQALLKKEISLKEHEAGLKELKRRLASTKATMTPPE